MRSNLRLLSFAAFAATINLASSPVNAQVLLSPAFEKADIPKGKDPKHASESSGQEPTKIRLHAAPEPDPALRFRLWPAAENRRNENSIPFVTRAVLLQHETFGRTPAAMKTMWKEFDEISDTPINELSVDKVRKFVKRYADGPLRELARADNRMSVTYDLGLDELGIGDIVSTLLPELQESRNLARMLHVRARLAIAEGRWEDAVSDLRVGLRLAEITGRSTDLLVGRLVGIAIASVMFGVIEEAIQQPGAPNLYWALASVPADRMFETLSSIETEVSFIGRIMGKASELPDSPIGMAAARMRLIDAANSAARACGVLEGQSFDDTNVQLIAGLYAVMFADPSREMLAETTDWGDRAFDLSASEAVLRAATLKIARVRDETLKWVFLPPDPPDRYDESVNDAMLSSVSVRDPITAVVGLLTPAIDAVRRAGRRGEQELRMLINLEALRMHAAVHGELPEKLDDLDPVPAWIDPVSSEPFGYLRTSSRTATLTRGPRFPGDEELQFEIELVATGDQE